MDQQMRTGPVDAAAWLVFDTESTALLREIVAAHGWPSRSLVGEDDALAAWLLALPHSEVDPHHPAYLHDRICIRERRAQRYGTQVRPDGQPFELEAGDVDGRRAEIGLEPLAEYLKRFQLL